MAGVEILKRRGSLGAGSFHRRREAGGSPPHAWGGSFGMEMIMETKADVLEQSFEAVEAAGVLAAREEQVVEQTGDQMVHGAGCGAGSSWTNCSELFRRPSKPLKAPSN